VSDNRKDTGLHSSQGSSSSAPSDQSVSRLLKQLYAAMVAYRTLLTQALEVVSLIPPSLAEVERKIDIIAAEQGLHRGETGQARESVARQSQVIVRLRDAIAGTKLSVEAQREVISKLNADITGEFALHPREPRRTWRDWLNWRTALERLAESGWPHVLRFLVAFALASLGASTAIQGLVDKVIEAASGRS
jgi:hypothetical protein